MRSMTAEQIETRLKEAGFPEKVIPSVMKEIDAFPPEVERLYVAWHDKGRLEDEAFDLLGITPKAIRGKFHGITDVGVLIVYGHLVKTIRNEFASLCSQVDVDARIANVEHELGEKMVKHAKSPLNMGSL